MTIGGADIVDTAEARITRRCCNVDRCFLHPDVRIGEVEVHELGNPPGRSDRGPDPVIVRRNRRPYLITDWRNLVGDAAAKSEPLVPIIFSAAREEPAVAILE